MCLNPTFDYGFIDPWTGSLAVPNDEDRYWYGHSLPPEMAHRTTDARNTWRNREMEDLVVALEPPQEGGLAGFHRKMKEAAEFAAVFGEMEPREFKHNLKEYLSEKHSTH